jgi:hypothetical protein
MKSILVTLALSFTASAFAQNLSLPDYKNYELTDIAAKGLKKEILFSKMNRDLMKVMASICSNRALVWAYDFKRFYNVDAGKIFLFYTKKSGDVGQKTWWYHVAPIVNEKGVIHVMDAGFPGDIRGPLAPKDWLKRFTSSTNCKEIKASETDLVERMFDGYTFPQTTSYGKYDCYYKYTPAGYWTPSAVAKGLLGVDEEGKPIQYSREEFDTDEVFYACVEAATGPVGRALGGGKKLCEKYLNL